MAFLVHLRRSGPAWRIGQPDRGQALWDEHAAFMNALVAEGVVVLGGPLADEERVVLACEAPSEQSLQATLARDPWSGSHLEVERIEPWRLALDARAPDPAAVGGNGLASAPQPAAPDGDALPHRAGIHDEDGLRELIGGGPTAVVRSKISDRLNHLTRQFVERSPFCCVATSRPGGGLDISPRGDPPGFVRILDERTLVVPDRPGNRIADTLTNLLVDPRIALLFLIPGVRETFRVNGTAEIVEDQELLAASAVEGKVPRLGLLVAVQEAYTQCPKALIRSELWNPDRHVDRSELPSSGEILRLLNDPSFDAEAYDRERAARYARREGLY